MENPEQENREEIEKQSLGAEELTENNVEPAEVLERTEQAEENPKKRNKKYKVSLKKVFNVILILIFLALIAIIYLWGPRIFKYLNFNSNQYGFDFNFNKVKDHDWDSVLTEKKISQAIGVSPQKINTVKNPDYSWALETPEQLVNQIICASLLEEKVLYELSESSNNLFNVSIMLCKDTKKSEELFNTRKNNIQLLVAQDNTLKIKTIGEPRNIGEGAYNYVLEKKNVTQPESGVEGATPQENTGYFSGIVYLRGPFIVRIEETQNDDVTVLADENVRANLAKQIDKELGSTLSVF